MTKNEAASNLDRIVKAWMDGETPSLEIAVSTLACYVMDSSSASNCAKILARILLNHVDEDAEKLRRKAKGSEQSSR